MENDSEKIKKYLCSSKSQFLRAINDFNNLNEKEKVQQFIIHMHIAFNRLFLSISFLNNFAEVVTKKGKVEKFDTLLNLFKSKNLLTKDEHKALGYFNQKRNEIEHSYLEDEEKISKHSDIIIFFMYLIEIYKSLLLKLNETISIPNIVLWNKESIFNNQNNLNPFVEDVSNFVAKVKNEQIFKDSENIQQIINLKFENNNVKFSGNINEDLKNSLSLKEAVFKIKEIVPSFTMQSLSKICKIFKIFTSEWNYKNLKSFRDYEPLSQYATITPAAKMINNLCVEKMVVYLKTLGENYKEVINEYVKREEHLDLDKITSEK